MQTLGGLGLMAALVICYLLYFKSQSPPTDAGADEGRPIAVAPALGRAPEVRRVAAPPSEYKMDMDRAHAAARQMQSAHDEANSY